VTKKSFFEHLQHSEGLKVFPQKHIMDQSGDSKYCHYAHGENLLAPTIQYSSSLDH
jgi:hypothetical protein